MNGPRLTTLRDWVCAGREEREAARATCLKRIQSLDGSIQAWVQVFPQRATAEGALSGIPFGAKDVMETRGLATEYGSAIYRGRVGAEDAAIVSELRSSGAILMGKTCTAAFAYRDPAPTRNPRNPAHTPGGSSSGSAAAVAAGMVPFALGTQTLGSVLRPASYCGVTGFKPSYGLFSLDGVLPLAESLDTLGFFSDTPADMLMLWEALGRAADDGEDFEAGAPDLLPEVAPQMQAAFQDAIGALRRAGVSVRLVDISPILRETADAANTIMFYEGARFHEQRFDEYGDRLGQLARLVREGLKIPASSYDDAKQLIARNKMRLREMYRATPVILTPAATGPAPLGLSFTGDPSMNAPWTALGTPAISIPLPVGDRLPLGLQLTAMPGCDARVLQTAVRFDGILNPESQGR